MPKEDDRIDQQDVANCYEEVAFEHNHIAPKEIPPVVTNRDFSEAIVKAVSIARKTAHGAHIPKHEGSKHGENHHFQYGACGKGGRGALSGFSDHADGVSR